MNDLALGQGSAGNSSLIRTALLIIGDDTNATQHHRSTIEERTDTIRNILSQGPFTEVDYEVVGQQASQIRPKMFVWADVRPVDVVLTTGGTGLNIRDRTYEATQAVIEESLYGVVDLMRLALIRKDRKASLFRLTCGYRKQTLFVNLPDNAAHIAIALSAILDVLPEASQLRAEGLTEAASYMTQFG